MTKTKKSKKIGVTAATGVAFFQGFEAILFNVFIFVFATAVLESNAFGAAVMAGKETIGIILAIIIIGPKVFIGLFKKLKSKEGLFYGIAAGIGTTFGNLFYILAIVNAGSSYGVILTALYPIMSLLLMKFIVKRRSEPLMV